MPLTLPCFFAFKKRQALGLLSALLLAAPTARAQAPAWQTAIACAQGANRHSDVSALAADASGNVYLAGSFAGTVSFGDIPLTSAGSDGHSDIFVAKWNSASARFVWARRAGGANDDYPTALTVSGTNVYVAGDFQGPSADFGSTTLSSVGGGPTNYHYDAFVAKLTDAGPSASFEWAQRAGGADDDFATGLAVSGTSVYLAGYLTSATADFGSATLTNGGNDVFLTKLTDVGSSASFTWTQQANGRVLDGAVAVAASGTSVYLAGAFSGTSSFGGTTLSAASSLFSDVFVARLTDAGSTGRFEWARRAGGVSDDQATTVAVSGASVYVAGVFTGAADFGSIPLTATAADNSDVFVTKLTDAGDFVWAQRAGGPDEDYAINLAAQGSSVYVVGNYASPRADFGTTTLTNAGAGPTDYNVFLTKLTDAGSTASFSWAQQGGSLGEDFGTAVAVGGPNVYVGGSVVPPARFGTQTISGAAGLNVGFLASLTDAATPTATASPLLAAGLSLYPNPAHGRVTLRLPAVPGITQATLTLRDALGRTVRTQDVLLPATGATTDLSLTDLPPGIYRLHVQAGTHHLTRPLAVE